MTRRVLVLIAVRVLVRQPVWVVELSRDAEQLDMWWKVHVHEIGDDTRGLWFGLLEQIEPDGSHRFTMYVAGTPDFDPNDGGDWACEYTWWSPDRYLSLDDLATFGSAHWTAALEHAIRVVREVAPWETAPPTVVGAGVGFDEGDMHVVWARP
ncbi:MAG: hypothetical protein GY708_03345 [Actinomycetia bacterium]|nr:hypothetical protein [Actinomycetes bacterium]